MPDHYMHTKINLMAAPLVIAGAYILTHDVRLTVVVGVSHVVSTAYLSPDLDLVNSSPDHMWGVLRWLWWPYGKVIHHRSILSHGGPLSAVLRIAYLILMFEIVGKGLDLLRVIQLSTVNAAIGQFVAAHAALVLALMAGVVTSDTVHTISDHLSTAIKVARHGGRNHWCELARHRR